MEMSVSENVENSFSHTDGYLWMCQRSDGGRYRCRDVGTRQSLMFSILFPSLPLSIFPSTRQLYNYVKEAWLKVNIARLQNWYFGRAIR